MKRIAALRHGAGIGEQHVDAAKLRGHARYPRRQRGCVGDVDRCASGLHAHCLQFGDGGRDLIRVARANRHARAFTGQRARNRPPNAARTAEHDGVSSLQTQIHCFFLFVSGGTVAEPYGGQSDPSAVAADSAAPSALST
jgi:hypothetical protein